MLKNAVSCYQHALKGDARSIEGEVTGWIKEGILISWIEEVESDVLPLMAVVQLTKHKVRSVLGFQELNDHVHGMYHVSCHTGGGATDVCYKTLRDNT